MPQEREKAYRDFAKSQLSETAKYLTAAWEYRNQPAIRRPAHRRFRRRAGACTPSPFGSGSTTSA